MQATMPLPLPPQQLGISIPPLQQPAAELPLQRGAAGAAAQVPLRPTCAQQLPLLSLLRQLPLPHEQLAALQQQQPAAQQAPSLQQDLSVTQQRILDTSTSTLWAILQCLWLSPGVAFRSVHLDQGAKNPLRRGFEGYWTARFKVLQEFTDSWQ